MELWIDVKLTETEPLRIFGARGQGAVMNYKERYQALFRKAFMKRLNVVGAPIAIYHSDHFDGQPNDLEAALPVVGDCEGVRELPGGLHACATHHGPYGLLPITHSLMGIWIIQNGYRIRGAPYDVYVGGGDDNILSPDQYITKVYIPVEEDIPLPDFEELP